MRILTGTSGWQYKEWKGTFYPPDITADAMLAFYADRFPAVEVNNTFYRLPKEDALRRWTASVPAGFVFVLKASQRITHFGRLGERSIEPLQYLLRTAAALDDHLGPLLFQLPPNFPKDLPRLRAFLGHLPPGSRAAFEFRHPSWIHHDVLQLLQQHQLALCVTSTEDDETPVHATGPYGYFRLRKMAYAQDELEKWTRRIRELPWTEAFVFFKHEDEGTGPLLAARFLEAWDATPSGGG